MSQSPSLSPSLSQWRSPREAPTNVLVMVIYRSGHRALSWLSPCDDQVLGRWWVRVPGGKKVGAEWPLAWHPIATPSSLADLQGIAREWEKG
jgi:hypothetical protein